MELTPKAKKILLILLQTDGKMTYQELANAMKVSKRTVLREMDVVAGFLKGTGVDLITKMGTGIWLEGENKQDLLKKLHNLEMYDAGNKDERRKRLILEILKEKELKKLYFYSNKFKVSESTISGDLEAVEEWFDKYSINIIRKSGSGIEIKGGEADYRRAIRVFIEENINTEFLKEIYEKDNPLDFSIQSAYRDIKKIFNDDLLKKVVAFVKEYAEVMPETLTEAAFLGLIIHITIAINRIMKGEIIENIPNLEKDVIEDEDYKMAVRLMNTIAKKFKIEIPKVEIFYIYLHLKGSKHEKIKYQNFDMHKKESQKIINVVNAMIDVFDPENAWFYKQDHEFIQALLSHLSPTIIRIYYNMNINNPVLDTVKSEYRDVFIRCIEAAKVLEKYLGREIPEEEIGFLAIHFGAAKVRLESQRERLRTVRMGVVCASGIGISRLMTSKLLKAFRDRVQITVYGKKDINPYIIAKTDFFVSSIAIEKTEIPVIYVNPLLNEKDMEKIHQFVQQYERMPEKLYEDDSFSLQFDKINIIATQINSVIKYMDVLRVDADISFEKLLSVIGEHLSPYIDRQEIIIKDIKSRQKISSQIFAEFGFALLHARSNGVVRPSLAICLPKDSVFTDPYFREIKVALIMLIPEDENIRINGEILGYLSSLLLEEDIFLETILEGNKNKTKNLVSRYLKDFFTEYLDKVK